jgi:uncharacterized protein YjbI with pentapeptide repeats
LICSTALVMFCWPFAVGAQAAGTTSEFTGNRHLPVSAAAGESEATSTRTFTRPGSFSYTVPPRVTKLTVVAVGGSGGSCPQASTVGGLGDAVTVIAAVSPGQNLAVTVGGSGGNCGSPEGGAGGVGGGGSGGAGAAGSLGGAGGGGASAVQVQGGPPSSASLLWASGGGGAAASSPRPITPANGGNAAGTTGELLPDEIGGNGGGTPGTQTYGGFGSYGYSDAIHGFQGSKGVGGAGAKAAACGNGQHDGGAGGGGGYYGGGGGGYYSGCGTTAGPAGGGGGSSFVSKAVTTLLGATNTSSPPGVSITYSTLPSGGPVQCLHQQTPPAPAPGEAVIARKADADSSAPNVVVIPLGSSWTATSCAGDDQAAVAQLMTHPTSIQVGAGAALLFDNHPASPGPPGRPLPDLYSPWGARDVSFGDPAPVLFPGRPNWVTTQADVVDPEYLLEVFSSCQSCSLPGIQFTPVQAMLPQLIGYEGNVSNADLGGAELDGTFNGWNLSGANLSGAQLSLASLAGAMFDHTTVDRARFGSADLRGAQFISLRFSTPPSFAGVRIGAFNGKCTLFKDTDLVNASLALVRPVGDCSQAPLLPGSSVPTDLLYTVSQTYHAQVDLAGAEFVSSASDRALLVGKDLSGIDLDDVRFVGFPVDLSRADLDGASLQHASFDLADLSGATFHNVNAAGASFRGAELEGPASVGGTSFAGSHTNLQGADFVEADVSDASFSGADLTGAVFSRALAADTDFNGVRAANADFDGAHIYGNGEAFSSATNLRGADFANAVLAGDVNQGGGFDLTKTDLTGAKFDGTDCIGCNFAGSRLGQVNFSGAYMPGAVFSGVITLNGANFVNAWLYCGDLSNSSCPADSDQPGRWSWPLELGTGEAFGPVPFATTNLKGTSFDDVAVCPDGKAGSVTPAGCDGHLLPKPAHAPTLPAPCSAAGSGACPTATSTLFDATAIGSPLAVVPANPPTWATTLSGQGYYAAFDDGTIRLVGAGAPRIVAGQAGKHCTSPASPCGDGGAATKALLGTPAGLAVGLDGSLYIADPALHRVRRIDPSGQISTVAGDGSACTTPATQAEPASSSCGDGGPATAAALAGPYGVWLSPDGQMYIADGIRGIRKVDPASGAITTIAAGGYDVRAVVGDLSGNLYATTNNPDYLIKITHAGQVTTVVGTGTSGYNGNTNASGSLSPGTAVRINHPQGLSLGLDGDVIFADTGNNLIRAYVPSSGHVIDDLGGLVSKGTPQGGFNGDGHWADQTKLDHPLSVAATGNSLFVIADTGNHRVREFGPSPLDEGP